jgi:DNA modification methylase
VFGDYNANMSPPKNTLNDLTGGEWLFRSKSVIKGNFGNGSLAHAVRRAANKTCKPPELCKTIVEVFTKVGDVVVDPFAGTGGIILGAQMAKRVAIGCELDNLQITAYREACNNIGVLFDDFDLEAIQHCNFFDRKWDKEPFADMIFTDPPYFDMDSRKKSKRWWKGKGSQERPMEPFKEKLAHFKSMEDWLAFITAFGKRAMEITKPNKYLVYFMEDAYFDGKYEFLSHTSAMAIEAAGWVPQGEYVWYNEARRPGIFGYPTKMITNRTHASILFFKKVVPNDRLDKNSLGAILEGADSNTGDKDLGGDTSQEKRMG